MSPKITTNVNGVVPFIEEVSTNVLSSVAQSNTVQAYIPGGDLASASVADMNNNLANALAKGVTEMTTGVGELAVGGLNNIANVAAHTVRPNNLLEMIPPAITAVGTAPLSVAITKVIQSVSPLLNRLLPKIGETTPVDEAQAVIEVGLASIEAVKVVGAVTTVAAEATKKAAMDAAQIGLTTAALATHWVGQGVRDAVKDSMAGATPQKVNLPRHSVSASEGSSNDSDISNLCSLAIPLTKSQVARKRSNEDSQKSDINPSPVLTVRKKSKSEDGSNAGGSLSAPLQSNSEPGSISKQEISICPEGNQKLRLNPEASQEVCTLNGELYLVEPLALEELTSVDDSFLILDETLTKFIVFLQDIKEKTSGPDTTNGESNIGETGVDSDDENNRIDYIIGDAILLIIVVSVAYKAGKSLADLIEKKF